ncbi:hypothetical protein [Corynebacterium sp. AOP12-C2-36]|uniref:hypothetical protein n=1 Tax=Corynebacterium sp. AOP12-C2-36 TaxID=3457723 RepID=UPI00403460CF
MRTTGSAKRLHPDTYPHSAWDRLRRNRAARYQQLPPDTLATLGATDMVTVARECWDQGITSADAARDAVVQLYTRHHLPLNTIAERTGISVTTVSRIVRHWPGSRTDSPNAAGTSDDGE